METKIIFEDEELLVIDKPSGVTVNKADTTKGEKTVQDWIEEHNDGAFTRHNPPKATQLLAGIASQRDDFYNRAGIVHRIDKETSGLLIVAKTPEAFVNLQQQFKERKVKKTYLALVHGEVKPVEGEIRVPVGRLPWNRKRFGVIAGGRDAVTHYKVVSSYTLNATAYTLLELYPQTGRTHQIRVHLKYFGHPIFADPLYGGRKQARDDRKILPRVFLHAAKISFQHPKSGFVVNFASPLPRELEKIIN